MENVNQLPQLKPKKQVRLGVLLVSTAIIVTTSLLAYNRITYEFPLAVGNTGQSALGPATSAGVGIVFAMIVVAAVLGFGALLSIFGSLRNVSNRISEVVRESLPRESTSESQEKAEWEDASTTSQSKATDEEILQALWHSKDKSASAESSTDEKNTSAD